MRRGQMLGVTYLCYGCGDQSLLRFALPYQPHAFWLMTCRKCHRYHGHRAVFADTWPICTSFPVAFRGADQ